MSTLVTDSTELTHFTAVFSRHDLAADLAPRLSYSEVEALAGLLRALGEPAAADTWIQNTPSTTSSATPTTRATPLSTWFRSTRWTPWAATAASKNRRAHA